MSWSQQDAGTGNRALQEQLIWESASQHSGKEHKSQLQLLAAEKTTKKSPVGSVE